MTARADVQPMPRRVLFTAGVIPPKTAVLSFPVRLTVEHGGQYHRHTTKIPKRSDHNPRAA